MAFNRKTYWRNKKDGYHYNLIIGFLAVLVLIVVLVAPERLARNEAEAKLRPILNPLVETPTPTVAPTPKPSDLESIVAYITRVFEKEGKEVVVRAINCFYSESGLREDAVGQNNDTRRSRDHGVAQLNDYWHNLTEEEKTEFKTNIERAYKIYKARGKNFSAWYGARCN